MDAISVAIVVTVLSLGSALVYLFKSDYEGRQSSNQPKQPPTTKRSQSQQQHQNVKTQLISMRLPSSKTLAPAALGTSSKQQQVPVEDTSVSNQRATRELKQVVARNSLEKSHFNGTTGHKQQQLLLNNIISSDDSVSIASSHQQHTSKKKEFESISSHRSAFEEPQSTDPSVDEVDSAVSFENFNGFSSLAINKLQNNADSDKTVSPKTSAERRHSGNYRRRHNVDHLSNGLATKDTYSSEKLFNLMAASNLSKEEIELAIETLLNKLESGSHDNDWKPAKSDPLHKLRNQLRDNEAALIAAIQNHELSQNQCSKLKLELKEEKSKVNQSREELERCKKELGVVKVALEQVRSNTSKQQLLDDERSNTIANLERIQSELKNAVANGATKETELRNELAENKLQLRKVELSNHSLMEKVRKLEMKLKSSELQIEKIHSNKNQTEYESSEKISELESEQARLSKALKDQSMRLNESIELSNNLQKSVNELKTVNGHLEELLKRQKDEKVVSESMLRGNISELERELKDLDSKLGIQKSELEGKNNQIQILRDELVDVNDKKTGIENELNEFQAEFIQLINDLPCGTEVKTGSWIRKFLDSTKYLKRSLIDLGEENKKLAELIEQLTEEKSSLLSDIKTLSSRSNSPTSVSKVSSKETDKSAERKLIDKKNLELENMQQELAKKENYSADLSWEVSRCQQQIKDLKLEKSKLEAQIKFGLDSLKMEQERARKLEEELEKYGIQIQQNP